MIRAAGDITTIHLAGVPVVRCVLVIVISPGGKKPPYLPWYFLTNAMPRMVRIKADCATAIPCKLNRHLIGTITCHLPLSIWDLFHNFGPIVTGGNHFQFISCRAGEVKPHFHFEQKFRLTSMLHTWRWCRISCESYHLFWNDAFWQGSDDYFLRCYF